MIVSLRLHQHSGLQFNYTLTALTLLDFSPGASKFTRTIGLGALRSARRSLVDVGVNTAIELRMGKESASLFAEVALQCVCTVTIKYTAI